MKSTLTQMLIAILALLLMNGCAKDGADPGADVDDEVVVEQLATDDEEALMYDLGIDDQHEDNMYNGYSSFANGFGKTNAPIDSVIRYGRIIRERGLRRLEIRRIARDTIAVLSARQFAGLFVTIQALEDTSGSHPITIYRKRLNHVVRRYAVYARHTRDNASDQLSDHRRGWHLDKISMGDGNSLPNHTITINEMTVVSSGGYNRTFTNPLETIYDSRDDLPTFSPGDSVTVTVKLRNETLNPVDPDSSGSTEKVLLHFGTNRHHHARKAFRYAGTDPVSGDQLYVGSWTVRQEAGGIYHAIVDVIDNGTIFDSDARTYPYNSRTWSTPYRVAVTDR